MKRCFLFSVILMAGCAIDEVGDETTELASTDQAVTILDQCAVGTAPNAQDILSASAPTDSYGRSATTMNLSGTGRCDCINWQGVFDVEGEAAADAAYPKCRPDAIYALRIKDTRDAHYTVFSEFTDKIHNQTDCSHSNLRMELWKQSTTNPNVYSRVWWGQQIAHWDAGRCYQTVGEASPNMTPGFWRIKAVATPANEQGYETIVLSGGLI